MKHIQTWILCIFLKALSAQDGGHFRRTLGRGKIFHKAQSDRLREKFSELNTTAEFSEWNVWRKRNGLLCRSRDNLKKAGKFLNKLLSVLTQTVTGWMIIWSAVTLLEE